LSLGFVLSSYILLQVAGAFWTKLIAMSDARGQRLIWQYAFCSIYAALGLIWTGDYSFTSVPLMLGLGLLNALACYASWRVFALSLSLGASFLQLYSIVALFLGLTVMAEQSLFHGFSLSFFLWLGSIGLSVLGTTKIFGGGACPASIKAGVIGWGAVAVLIWGCTTAVIRMIASGSDASNFPALLSWYSGSFIGAVLLARYRISEGFCQRLRWSQLFGVALYAGYVFASIYFVYALFEVLPLSYSQPVMNGIQVLVPVLVGAAFFGESDMLDRSKIIGILMILAAQFIVAAAMFFK
jgi:multidrug transporter EmrE-like cation transporter